MAAKQITLRYFDGCPNWKVARQRVEEALSRLDRDAQLCLEPVDTPGQADRLQFRGSPTILVDGKDPFDSVGPTGLSCRVYRTDVGLQGAPSVEQLMVALRETS